MSIKLYMDVHVPRVIAEALRARGVDVLTAQEDGTDRYPDSDLLDRAAELDRVLYTQDKDFEAICAHRQALYIPFAGVIFGQQTAVTLGRAIQDLEYLATAGEPEDLANRLERLPL